MIGIILAAGSGTRLRGSDVVRPKCLAPFAGRPLLEIQLAALRACGVDDIAVVVGFEADRVRSACGPSVRCIENAAFATTNSLYSLWMARTLLKDGFVVLNCDVLFHPQMLHDLLGARHDDALLVSYPDPGAPPFGDEEMKVHVRLGRVTEIGKDLPTERTDGENVGIAKFSPAGAHRLVELMDRLVAGGSTRAWAPRAFGEFARVHPLFAVGTRGLPWTEIDTAEDYQYAVETIFPAIAEDIEILEPQALRRGA
jgi:choline kinase